MKRGKLWPGQHLAPIPCRIWTSFSSDVAKGPFVPPAPRPSRSELCTGNLREGFVPSTSQIPECFFQASTCAGTFCSRRGVGRDFWSGRSCSSSGGSRWKMSPGWFSSDPAACSALGEAGGAQPGVWWPQLPPGLAPRVLSSAVGFCPLLNPLHGGLWLPAPWLCCQSGFLLVFGRDKNPSGRREHLRRSLKLRFFRSWV